MLYIWNSRLYPVTELHCSIEKASHTNRNCPVRQGMEIAAQIRHFLMILTLSEYYEIKHVRNQS